MCACACVRDQARAEERRNKREKRKGEERANENKERRETLYQEKKSPGGKQKHSPLPPTHTKDLELKGGKKDQRPTKLKQKSHLGESGKGPEHPKLYSKDWCPLRANRLRRSPDSRALPNWGVLMSPLLSR